MPAVPTKFFGLTFAGSFESYLRSHFFALIFQPLTLNPKILYCFCTADPVSQDFPVWAVLGSQRGNYGGCDRLPKALEEVPQEQAGESASTQTMQMSLLAAMGQGRQALRQDALFGDCNESGSPQPPLRYKTALAFLLYLPFFIHCRDSRPGQPSS